MKIKMLDTVEDTHRHIGKDKLGKEVVGYSKLKLIKGKEYSDLGDDWSARAEGLVAKGFAEKVANS